MGKRKEEGEPGGRRVLQKKTSEIKARLHSAIRGREEEKEDIRYGKPCAGTCP